MKKINNNNKFRGNAVYSLNYKFDSVSPAGKCSGTALDLIKRYNELAKEAQNNGDYVGMEVFRQYAEHYRKIVTEINERKYQTREAPNAASNVAEEVTSAEKAAVAENGLVETEGVAPATSQAETTAEIKAEKPQLRRRRNFTVVEVSEPETTATEQKPETVAEPKNEAPTENKPRRRSCVRKTKPAAETAEA